MVPGEIGGGDVVAPRYWNLERHCRIPTRTRVYLVNFYFLLLGFGNLEKRKRRMEFNLLG